MSDTRETITIDVEEAKSRLSEAWKVARFERLAGTALDIPGVTENPYWDIVRLMRVEKDPWMDPWPIDWYRGDGPTRRSLVNTFAWSIPSPADVLWMRDILDGRGVVEIGAGSGYWAWQLRQLGTEVVAVDNGDWSTEWKKRWSPVGDGNTRVAREHPEKALMLIWPPYGSPMAATALDSYAGDLVFYAGEDYEGCTGDNAFHEALAAGWEHIAEAPHHPTFDGIHCRLNAYRRTDHQ